MHVVAVVGIVVVAVLLLWALAHFAGVWGVLTLSIGLGGSPGVNVEPNRGFHVQPPPASRPAPATAAPVAAPSVSAETRQVLTAIENLARAQEARDGRQDGRITAIEERLDGLSAQRPQMLPDCYSGGPPPRFGPPQEVRPR